MTKTIALKLDTDYKTVGNSSGQQIDTLAIALEGEDLNGVEEYNIDYLWEVEDGAKKYWLENDAEAFFRDSLTKEELLAYSEDLVAYDAALEAYKEQFEEVRAGDWDTSSVHAEALKACADAMEKSLSDAQKELYHDWLHGDYRGNFEGILPKANKYIDGVGFEYNEKEDVLYIEAEEAVLQSMVEDGELEEATMEALKDYVESSIERSAYYRHAEEVKKREARAEEYRKTREYKEKARLASIEKKKNTLKELALKK